VSIGVAGRVVPVMHLIAFRRLQAAPADHDDGASWWFWPRRWSIVVVAPARPRAAACDRWYQWYQRCQWGAQLPPARRAARRPGRLFAGPSARPPVRRPVRPAGLGTRRPAPPKEPW